MRLLWLGIAEEFDIGNSLLAAELSKNASRFLPITFVI